MNLTRTQAKHMNTTFDLVIRSDQNSRAEKILRQAHEYITQLEHDVSEFIPTSPVARWNRGEREPFTGAAAKLFDLAERLATKTRRAFDPFAKDPAAQHLSFGAIGKGFALDEIRLLIEDAGFEHYLLNAGGSSILAQGEAAPGRSWTVGWSWKKDSTGEPLGLPLNLPTQAIAMGTSGSMEQGHHILDPRTGDPVTDKLSACVLHPSAAWADALSTALYVLDWKEALELFFDEIVPHPALAIISAREELTHNGTFAPLLQLREDAMIKQGPTLTI